MDTSHVIRITTWSPEGVNLAVQRGICVQGI
jgi:hypothetical protein